MEYLEATSRAKDEEEKVASLLSELRLEGVDSILLLRMEMCRRHVEGTKLFKEILNLIMMREFWTINSEFGDTLQPCALNWRYLICNTWTS